ncbi:YcaO-like family protein [Photobacterium kasasachensis]|uniref:YcaO-like family protein n=1 Tax=Photobacterium kasasachensis TaxID=2910240 RepID=UPI003D0C103B
MISKKHQRGTHRSRSPQSTFDKISPFLKEMGITRIANITGLDHIGIPVVTVCRPASCAISVAQGKGLDLISAKVSGAMEAIETYHAEHIDLPLKLASYNQMSSKHHVVDVTGLPRLAFGTFSEHSQRLWIEGEELFTNTPIYIPYDVTHCNYTLPLPTGSGTFVMSSNGLASGNSTEEAIVHGLCEVIERDALALWRVEKDHLSQQDTRLLKLDTVDDLDCLSVIKKYQAADIDIQIWDITSDIGLPSFYCKIAPKSKTTGPHYPSAGSGTHPCKSIALLRALTEAAQTRLTMISGSRDDIEANNYQTSTSSIRCIDSTSTHGARSFQDILSWNFEHFEHDIELILHKLNNVGLKQVGVVNLTKDDYQIPVVRVVVPGLEGIDESPGYVGGQRALKLNNSLTQGGEK